MVLVADQEVDGDRDVRLNYTAAMAPPSAFFTLRVDSLYDEDTAYRITIRRHHN